MKAMDCKGFAFDAFDKSLLSLKHVKYTGIKKGRSLQCCLVLIAWFIFNEVSVLSELQPIQKYLSSYPITEIRNQKSYCVSATEYTGLTEGIIFVNIHNIFLYTCLCVWCLLKIAHSRIRVWGIWYLQQVSGHKSMSQPFLNVDINDTVFVFFCMSFYWICCTNYSIRCSYDRITSSSIHIRHQLLSACLKFKFEIPGHLY